MNSVETRVRPREPCLHPVQRLLGNSGLGEIRAHLGHFCLGDPVRNGRQTGLDAKREHGRLDGSWILLVDDGLDYQLLRGLHRLVELGRAPFKRLGKKMDGPEQVNRRVRVRNLPQRGMRGLRGAPLCGRRSQQERNAKRCSNSVHH